MKCVVPGANVKILAKAIHSLAKVGDEMYVEPQDTGISFRTVNMARSAYAGFTFSQNYFSYYTFGNLEEDDALRCQITMRSAMAVFKAPSTLDRQLEACQINLEAKSCKLVFILKYRNGITKTHFLPIIDCQILQAVFSQKTASNQLTAHHKVMSEAMLNFQPGLVEITLEVTPQKVLLRNYLDDASDLSKVTNTRTQLALGVGEFDQYKIGTDTSITFCVKEFKAVLSFAEAVSLPVSVHFETAGKPVIFIIKSSTFESNVVLSTLSPDSDSQSEATTVQARERTMLKKGTGNKRTARKTGESMKRKAPSKPNKYRTKNNTASTSTEITSIEPKNGHNNTHQQEAIDSNEDYLFAHVGDNVSVDTDTTCRKSFVSRKSKNAHASGNSEDGGKSSDKSSPAPSSKNTIKSIFSTIINNKQRSEATLTTVSMNEDIVPNSPPRHVTKKARVIFNKCFQTTFDPRMLPGHDIILAEDTDESD